MGNIKSFEAQAQAQAALDFIENHPHIHNQTNWIGGNEPAKVDLQDEGCGTTMCVAGTVNFLNNGVNWHDYDHEDVASEALELSHTESQVLFYEMNEARAVEKLRKLANGKAWNEDDFTYIRRDYKGILHTEDYVPEARKHNLLDKE